MPNFEQFNPINPEKPKEEPTIKQEGEEIEKGQESPEMSPEDLAGTGGEAIKSEAEAEYNKEEWEDMKQKRPPASAIDKGRVLGVPEEEIEKFAREIIERELDDPVFVYRFMKNMGIGTEEELKFAEEKAKKSAIKGEAEEKKGRGKKEKIEKEEEEGEFEEEIIVRLSKSATFADLFEAIDNLEQEGEEVHFEEELWDNFDEEVVEEILELRNNLSKAAKIKIISFFRKHEYSGKDITTYLPIKFKKERKNK